MQHSLIYPVACHTDNVGPGTTFVAIKGMNLNGIAYIKAAIERGATKVVVEHVDVLPEDVQEAINQHDIELIRVTNTRLALAELSAHAAGYPANKLRIIGITGTKGKTTSAFLLEHVLRTAGYTTALLGTIKNSIMDYNLGTGLTTQQPDYLHQFFKMCVEQDVDYVIMEVAAQGLTLHRTHGITFDGILFTNFSQEHAEFYASLDEYFNAKCMIFNQRGSQAPIIINADDARLSPLLSEYPGSIGFSFVSDNVAVKACIEGNVGQAITCTVTWAGNQPHTFNCPALIGTYNAYNIVGIVTLANALGIDNTLIATALQTFTRVPGRMERHAVSNGAVFIIDYAHNPSSFESILSTLSSLTDKLIVMFGCGGDRDATKRPLMGAIAAQYADLVVLTSDNPRSENPDDIIDAIMRGITLCDEEKVVKIPDRKEAIEYAYSQSQPGTIIALLGKGPDEYQIIGTQKTYFSEAEIIKSL